eukprot:494601-Amphidinium_carterae.1
MATQTEAFVDVAATLAEGSPIATYICGPASTSIDRVIVSRSMWSRIRSMHIITDMAMGPHRPLVVQFATDAIPSHPRLNNVGEILEGPSPPDADRVEAWQVSKMPDFLLFEEAAQNLDVDR